MHILLVDQTGHPLDLWSSDLLRNGLTVDRVETVAEALVAMSNGSQDIVVAVMGLSSGSVMQLLDQIPQEQHSTPVIVILANDNPAERVNFLNAGVDDCLPESVALDELVARIRAVARRGVEPPEKPLVFAAITFSPRRLQAVINGHPVVLPLHLTTLLTTLLERPGEPVRREVLCSRLGGLDEAIGANTLEVYIYQLRRRLAEADARTSIATIRGLGYALRAAETWQDTVSDLIEPSMT